jgi:phage-related protein
MLLTLRDVRVDFATNHHVNTKDERMDFNDFPHIVDLYNSLSPFIVLMGSVQSMKAAPLTSKVHTPDREWVKMGDLKVGDPVSTPNGKTAKIEGIQKHGVQNTYRFDLDDARSVETSIDHKWKVLRSTQKSKLSKGRKSLQWNVSKDFEILSTGEIQNQMCDGKTRFKIPAPEQPVEKPEKIQPLDPYFVGLMLCDGKIHWTNLRFCSEDNEALDWVRDYVSKFGLGIKQDGETCNYFFTGGKTILRDKFKELGLIGTYSHTKFIPEIYKNGSVHQRMELLKGVLDSDGCASDGSLTISLSSKQFIEDLQEITWSIGGEAVMSSRPSHYVKDGEKIPGRTAYILRLTLPNPKEARRKRTLGATITKVTKSKPQEVQCLVLDDKDHLYLMDNYVVTHNSEWLIIDHFAAAYCGLSIFYVLPKIDMRTVYVQNRINRCVQSVPRYKKIVGDGFFDSVALKNFGSGVVKYIGSNVFKDFREFPADVVVIDEFDECDQTNIKFASDRLSASRYKFYRMIANPSVVGEGIHKQFLLTNQQERYAPCMSCGKYSELDWFKTAVNVKRDGSGNIVEYYLKDTEWYEGCRRDIHLICPCGGILERVSHRGLWLPKADSDRDGFHISKLCTPLCDVADLWGTFESAQNNPGLLQQFYNSDLGLPFSAEGSKLTTHLLNCCIDPYVLHSREDHNCIEGDSCVGPCSMGIDVGGSLDIRISQHLNGQRKAVYIGKIKPSIAHLLELIERYNVQHVVIDAKPELTFVEDFKQAAAPTPVWGCDYSGEGKKGVVKYDRSNRTIRVDKTACGDRLLGSFKAGKNRLPENWSVMLNGRYKKEMLAPVRQLLTDDKGNSHYEWTKPSADHQFHADVYDYLASEFMGTNVITEVHIG